MLWPGSLVECPIGAILECTVLKDVILSLGSGCCCCFSLLSYIIMSLTEFSIGKLDRLSVLFYFVIDSHFDLCLNYVFHV